MGPGTNSTDKDIRAQQSEPRGLVLWGREKDNLSFTGHSRLYKSRKHQRNEDPLEHFFPSQNVLLLNS